MKNDTLNDDNDSNNDEECRSSEDAFSVGWEDNNNNNNDSSSNNNNNNSNTDAIVVGYAFGPKKMSTMGLVMAEASRTQFTLATEQLTAMTNTNASADATDAIPSEDTHSKQEKVEIIFEADLRKIVRHFHSSCCSSMADSTTTSTGTRTASTVWTTSSTHVPITTITMNKNNNNNNQSKHTASLVPLRVSFVPLDLEMPIEQQHGGRIDVILHKLTEDILTCSQLERKQQQGTDTTTSLPAIQRVQRLIDFSTRHGCPLVDDPKQVQRLMNRSHIAQTLATCLPGVTSASGRTVKAPPYVVWNNHDNTHRQGNPEKDPIALIKQAGFSFPLIVKPLTAAGTKASHSMAVLLKPQALYEPSSQQQPCLVQAYVNHDAWLYKVYVLGDMVSVHKRRSLPNLPPTPPEGGGTLSRIAFDSQRPYPRLRDFGYTATTTPAGVDASNTSTAAITATTSTTAMATSTTAMTTMTTTIPVSAEEVQPVVTALKEALKLELFGFDVICEATTNTLFVVDVNYFPSYKEVPNFAALLAKFLTDRALERRASRVATQQERSYKKHMSIQEPSQEKTAGRNDNSDSNYNSPSTMKHDEL